MEHKTPPQGCRFEQFSNWPRVALEHERAYLSSVMDEQKAFATREVKSLIMHDLMDIDHLLSLDPPPDNPSPLGADSGR
jgi:hypothetical protein